MKTSRRWLFVAALLPLAACAGTPKAPPAPPSSPPLTDADATFIEKAAQTNVFEIATAKLAATQSHNPHVTSFATQLVSDHTANQDKLNAIATQHGVTLPTDPSTDEEHMLDTLKSEKAHAFDHDFIDLQVAGHRDALTLFQTEAQSGSDPALKAYAGETVPTLQSHLDMAQAMGQHHRRYRHHQ
jgi:putative membrane protein